MKSARLHCIHYFIINSTLNYELLTIELRFDNEDLIALFYVFITLIIELNFGNQLKDLTK